MNTSLKTINTKTAEGCEKCGEWRLLREIGRGAYGVVYLAEASGGRLAALKLCRRAGTEKERYARELRGAKLYMSVSASEGLVGMREVVEEDWGFYSVMDLADDEFDRADASPESYRPKTLAKVIEGEKALPLKECVKLGIALAKGLAVLQRHHLLHRDIKPGNVIYIGGKPVLSDPGLLVEEAQASSLVGTPGYVPPEKFTDSASDIYSLGLTLKAASFGRRVEDLDKGPAQEADTGAPFFPAWWRILNKATDPDTSRRYRSAKALLKDLQALRRKAAVMSIARAHATKIALALILAIVASVIVVMRRPHKPTAPNPFPEQMQFAKYILSTRNWIDALTKEAFGLNRIATRLCHEVETAADPQKLEKENSFRAGWGISPIQVSAETDVLRQNQPRLVELKKQARDFATKICVERGRFKRLISKAGKAGTSDGALRKSIDEIVAKVQNEMAQGIAVEKEIYSIGKIVYGSEKWDKELAPDWQGNFDINSGFGLTKDEWDIFKKATSILGIDWGAVK
jgi:serine/threonine protein kinase